MSPMTRGFSPGGVPGADVAAYYRRRAEGGVGLIITEGIYIAHPSAGNDTMIPRLDVTGAEVGWRRVVDGIHEAGARVFAQLWHVGLAATTSRTTDPSVRLLGPSGVTPAGIPVDEPMTPHELSDTLDGYAKSAAAAKAVGFDGIEIHAAHGYLLDQFFWERTNRRNDAYGGDIRSRARFACEVIRACRDAVGPDLVIGLRFSQWKIADYAARLVVTPDQLELFLDPLSDSGVDIFHCSTRRYWEPEFSGSDLNLAGWTRKLTGRPTITVGCVGLTDDLMTSNGHASPAGIGRLIGMLDRNEFDIAAVGRALIADPTWPNKLRYNAKPEMLPFSRSLLANLI
jgi:2,4-dienoyl-CoA reductase-like NADH-dependent reductase (Old Yellow Enzyme family)